MRVAIRADASTEIGTGHVMRCLTLAAELRRQGAEVGFVCRAHPGHLGDLVSARGFALSLLPAAERRTSIEASGLAHAAWLGADWQADAQETHEFLLGMGGTDWLVVDHYALDARWERAQRGAAKNILVLDDLADRPHECDILLDQNLHPDAAQRYAHNLTKDCIKLLGPRYALLRDEFREARYSLRERDGRVRRILIFFGGVDADNMTGRVLQTLLNMRPEGVAIDVVLTPSSIQGEVVRRRAEGIPGVTVLDRVGGMARLMADADLAIGAAGGATWERCCVGLPTVIVPLAANQVPGLRAMGDSGAVFVATEAVDLPDDMTEAIRTAVAFALGSRAALRHQTKQALGIADGRGAQRLVRFMQLPGLTLRPATQADGRAIYEWRNSPEIRRFSKDPAPIEEAAHTAWLERTLAGDETDLLISELAGAPIGVLRYDRKGNAATVSIYVTPKRLGENWGEVLLEAGERWLRKHHPNVARVRAEVIAGNDASKAMFESAGYVGVIHQFEKQLAQ